MKQRFDPELIREHLREDADEARVQRMWRHIEARRAATLLRSRRVVAGRLALVAAVTAAAAVAGALLAAKEDAPVVTPLRLESASALPDAFGEDRQVRVQFDDGSFLTTAPAARVDLLEASPSVTTFALRRGRVRFDIRPHGPRTWRVDCGPVVVEVVGTAFTLERRGDRVDVHVHRGAVLVRGDQVPDRVQRLEAGERLVADASEPPTVPDIPAPPEAVQEPDVTARQQPEREPATPPAWREQATHGHFDQAYRELGSGGVAQQSRRATDVDELQSLADVARLSGHPSDAIAPLSRIIDEHPEDGRAALAAYTRGRIRLDSLGDPGRAVADFRLSLRLGLPVALQEPATFRLLEALRAERDPALRQEAHAYLARYPNSVRAAEVGRWLE